MKNAYKYLKTKGSSYIYDICAYKEEFENYYETLIECIITSNQINQSVLRCIIKIKALRVLKLYMFEDGTFIAIRPNGKRTVYNCKTPKQMISILNKIIKAM